MARTDGDGDRRLWRLLELGRGLMAELDLDAVLERIVEAAVDLTGARYGALGVLDERGDRLARFITVGVDEERRRAIGDPPRGHGVLGVLIQDPRPLRLEDVGSHPESFGFPAGHPRMRSFLGMPVRVGRQVFGNLYLTEKEGGAAFDAGDEALLVALADWAGVAIANAHRFGGLSGRRNELERAVHAFEITSEISRALAGETELAPVLELIVKRARALVGARGTVLALADAGGLVVRATAGHAGDLGGARVTVPGSLVGEVLATGDPARADDAAGPALGLDVAAGAALAVPLRFRGEQLGVLVAFDRLDGRPFDPEDERLLGAFALSAAPAVATARTVATLQLRRSMEAAERERTRWARELHDDTLQDLAAIKTLLSSARRSGDPADVERAVDAAVEHLQLGIGNLRSLIADLRPAALDELGPEAALQGLVRRFEQTSGVEVRLDLALAADRGRAGGHRHADLEDALYRIVQEALTNVAKHAHAGCVDVSVRETAGAVAISVADDGRGFDPDAQADGFGLTGMRERAALAGGSLVVEPRRPAGTIVRAMLPVHRREPAPGARTRSAARGSARLAG